jgi:SAM-dependent methyltransferase
MLPANQEVIRAWNTVLFDKWVRFRHAVTDGLAIHGTRAMDLHPPRAGARVVDIGCGFGDTTRELARRVGPSGHAVGIDVAERFIEIARAEAAGVPNVELQLADVEAAVPGGPYELAFSRIGTMFFASPVIALRNIRAALAPGGKLCMVVWRKKEANEAFYPAELIVRDVLGDPPQGDHVTCGPGPFSMASCDLVSDQLLAAGYRDATFERCDADMQIGKDLDDAIEFSLAIGPAGEVVRLAGAAAAARRDEIVGALRRDLAKYVRADGVWAPSTTWIVTATA